MKITKLPCGIPAMILGVSMGLGLVDPANAYSVYRSVGSTQGDAANWTATSFSVSGFPTALTFFYFSNDSAARAAMPSAQCFVKVDLVT